MSSSESPVRSRVVLGTVGLLCALAACEASKEPTVVAGDDGGPPKQVDDAATVSAVADVVEGGGAACHLDVDQCPSASCCGREGFRVDLLAGCTTSRATPLGCEARPGSGPCSGNAAIGCVVRDADGGEREAFWTPSEWSPSSLPGFRACDAALQDEVMAARRTKCPSDAGTSD